LPKISERILTREAQNPLRVLAHHYPSAVEPVFCFKTQFRTTYIDLGYTGILRFLCI